MSDPSRMTVFRGESRRGAKVIKAASIEPRQYIRNRFETRVQNGCRKHVKMNLQMKEIQNRAAMANADVHIAVAAGHGKHQCFDMLIRESEHVAVDEKENVVGGVLDSDSHRATLALIFAEGDGANLKASGDFHRPVCDPSLPRYLVMIGFRCRAVILG